MEKVQKFLEEYKKNPQAAELPGGQKPLSDGEIVKRLADAAKKLGFDVSEAELKEHFDNVRRKAQEKTDSVVAKIEAEADDVLEEVAGGAEDMNLDSDYGKDNGCGWTYMFYCAEVIYKF